MLDGGATSVGCLIQTRDNGGWGLSMWQGGQASNIFWIIPRNLPKFFKIYKMYELHFARIQRKFHHPVSTTNDIIFL